MINRIIQILSAGVLLLVYSNALAQPGSYNYNKVWVLGEEITYSAEFDSATAAVNQIRNQAQLARCITAPEQLNRVGVYRGQRTCGNCKSNMRRCVFVLPPNLTS